MGPAEMSIYLCSVFIKIYWDRYEIASIHKHLDLNNFSLLI